MASICAGGALGYWGDRAWNTKPWLTIAGLLFGIAAGFYQFIRASLGTRPGGRI